MKRVRLVPDPNQMEYHYDIKEQLENAALEKIAGGNGEEYLKQFSEHEAQTILFGLRSWDYVDIRFVPDGDSGKVAILFSITDAGRKYAEILRQHQLQRSLAG